MLELLGSPECFPFTVALTVMVIIGAVEGASTLLGLSASAGLESILPDVDLPDLDPGIDADIDAPGDMLSQTLSWLRVGRVPVLILLILFLAAFGASGVVLQALLRSLTGWLAPGWLAAVPAFLVAVPVMRGLADLTARVLPQDETSAVSRRTFIGRVAEIVLGTAKTGEPAQARVRDGLGRTHYVMVEPDVNGEEFHAGDAVLLVRADGPRFRAIRPENEALLRPGSQPE